MLEEDYSFNCPYCASGLAVRLDVSGGADQRFIQDCEICCRPIEIECRFKDGQVAAFSARASD